MKMRTVMRGAAKATSAIAVTVLVLVLLSAVPVWQEAAAQSDARRLLGGVTVEQILRHALLSAQTVDYEGTKVLSVLRGPLMETVTISEAHKRPNRMRLEFLSPEGLAGRIVVDDGVQTWHYEPRLHTVIQGPSLGVPVDAPPDRSDRWLARHTVRLLGVEEVIGRQTAVLSAQPREGRGERRLWIDRTTGVALRTEERDPTDGLVATTYFTRISFGLNVPAALFQPRIPAGARVVSPTEPSRPLTPISVLEGTVGFRLQVPETVPGGFILQGGEPVVAGPVVAAHLRYSDGARALALFVVPARRVGAPGRGALVPSL
ncbi:MAG: LolA family protein, partial [Armatimonadota bacterium]